MSIELSEREILELKKLHRQLRNKGDAKSADRIKTIISLARGYSYSEVAEILLLDEATIREYSKKYESGGLNELLANYYKPYEGNLSKEEIEILRTELDSKIFMDSAAVCVYILDTFGLQYTERGCRDLLHRIGYVYKKPVGVPEKADAEAQRKFVRRYKRLKRQKKQDEVFLFTDAMHPTHNSKPAYPTRWDFRFLHCQ
jgi:transposase